MKYLLDTHLLIWLASAPRRVSATALAIVDDDANDLIFSASSIWEATIKHALRKPDFTSDPVSLYTGLLQRGFRELAVTAVHGLAVAGLPAIHKDPFDRILIAQARVEDVTLITGDEKMARYPGPIRLV